MSYETKTIGSYTIAEKDIDLFIKNLPREQQAYASNPRFRDQVAEQLEQISLFALLGEEYHLDQTEAFLEAMKATRRDMLGQYAIQAVLNTVSVEDAEVAAYYVTHKNTFAEGAHASASHILVDSEEKALSVKKELEDGLLSFEEAAGKYSSCPSASKGGDLGDFAPGQMVPEFDRVVFSGEVGKVLGPVQTQFGYHLIRINSRADSNVPELESIKDRVTKTLLNEKREQAFADKLEELKAKYLKAAD